MASSGECCNEHSDSTKCGDFPSGKNGKIFKCWPNLWRKSFFKYFRKMVNSEIGFQYVIQVLSPFYRQEEHL